MSVQRLDEFNAFNRLYPMNELDELLGLNELLENICIWKHLLNMLSKLEIVNYKTFNGFKTQR